MAPASALIVAAAAVWGASCSAALGRPPSPSGAAFDPVGSYDLVLSWEGGVQEGRMVVRGEPGRYGGQLSAGSLSASIRNVQVEQGRLTVRAATAPGDDAGETIVLRFAVDDDLLSGEWFFGAMRGGVNAIKQAPGADGARGAAGSRSGPARADPPGSRVDGYPGRRGARPSSPA